MTAREPRRASKGHYSVYGRVHPILFWFMVMVGCVVLLVPDGDVLAHLDDVRVWLPMLGWVALSWRSLIGGVFVLPGRRVRCRRLFFTVEVDADAVANCEVTLDLVPFGYKLGLSNIYGACVRLKNGRGIAVPAIFGRRKRVERICKELLQDIRAR